MAYGYMTQNYEPKSQARAVALSLPISTKKTIEICNRIRGKQLSKAKGYLSRVMEMRQAVAYTKFNKGGAGHKPGMAVGRFPIKTAAHLLKLLDSVEANAESKGLNTGTLAIIHIAAQQGGKAMHYGRQGRRKMKRTTVEIVVAEKEQKKEKK
ncbi:MAG TPA: 50S ribosomal protein L22 [Candidatus Nanoarchaeia archaeon]|nr:50S ribosomal protein L22 [Candidatus Nanoarchaeia archaeon]